MDSLKATNQQLTNSQAVNPVPVPPSHSELPRFMLLEKFDGSAERCQGFLRQCENFFAQQPEAYGSETSRSAFMLFLLTGKALHWASDPQVNNSANYFAGLIYKCSNTQKRLGVGTPTPYTTAAMLLLCESRPSSVSLPRETYHFSGGEN